MRVAIYIRVSTKMQEDKYSLSAQTHELTRYVKVMRWEIVNIYKDVDSGTKIDKDGLESMLDAVEEGKIDVVLCIEQDRLSRLDTIKWEYLKGILRKNKVKIAEPGRIVDLTNENDEFFADFDNLMAQRSRKDMLRKMNRGKKQRTREGKVWGRQPEEYHYNPVTEVITINEKRAWIIPFIDDLFLVKKLGLTAIASKLNERCSTANGKKWTDTQVRAKLIRKAYHGVFERVFKSETITNENIYPKLRTEETYARIMIELEKRYNYKPTEPHMLRDINIKCTNCGENVTVKKLVSFGRKAGQRYEGYAIEHSSEQISSKCEVKPYVNTKRIEYQLIETVKKILMDDDTSQQYIDSGFDKNEIDALKKDIKELEKRKQDTNSKIDKLLDLYLDGTWPKDRLDAEHKKLDKHLLVIEEDLLERKRKKDLIQSKKINFDTVVEYLSVAKRFDKLLDVEDQQELIGSLFPTASLNVEDETLILHAELPQEVTVDIPIKIEPMESVQEREILEAAKVRYKRAQKYLNDNPGLTLEALGRAMGSQPKTLRLDQERFGPFKHLTPNKYCPMLKAKRIQLIKKELKKNPNASGRTLEKETGINRKMIYKLIKEEGLKI